MRVAIVGAGLMGTRLALRAAERGCTTRLVARDPARAREALQAAARETGDWVDASDVEVTADLGEGVQDAELVAEAIPEQLDAKRRLIAEIEAHVGASVPIASGTSTFPPDDLGGDARAPGRVLVAHMVHPVTLISIVEVVLPKDPDPHAVATLDRWIAVMGMRAVRLRAAITGFVVNRLQFALLREACALVEQGIVAPEDVDTIVEDALGPRWAATGPFTSTDLGGRATFAAVARRVVPTLDARDHVPLLDGEGTVRSWPDDALNTARQVRRRVWDAIEAAKA